MTEREKQIAGIEAEDARPVEKYRAQQCDDGEWMICTDDEVICEMEHNLEPETKKLRAQFVVDVLNETAATFWTFEEATKIVSPKQIR